ncbi:MAG: glycosyltransferase family 4 protein [Bacillota bacterium]|nr:glycosyltransferase family 4 protein [Bacillota bacterium]
MRVLLTTEFFLSGQSTHVLDLAIQLQRLGHSAGIVFAGIHSSMFQSYYAPMLKKAGITYHITNHRPEINQIIRRFQPDVIHSHSSTIFSLTKNIAKNHRIPFVVTCHGLGFSHPKYQPALEHAQRIIAVGPNSAAEIMQAHKDKIVIIPNGVDIERFTPARKEKTLTVYYIARLDWPKVYPLKKLAQAVAEISNLNLVIVANWQPPVSSGEYLPWQVDIETLLARANIVAGCGRTAREAMASGCAVLLMNTRYDGIIDQQAVRDPGFSFAGTQGRCTFSQLAKDLALLAKSRRRLRKLQRFSRVYALEHLGSRAMVEKTIAVYQEAIREFQAQYLRASFRSPSHAWHAPKYAYGFHQKRPRF